LDREVTDAATSKERWTGHREQTSFAPYSFDHVSQHQRSLSLAAVNTSAANQSFHTFIYYAIMHKHQHTHTTENKKDKKPSCR